MLKAEHLSLLARMCRVITHRGIDKQGSVVRDAGSRGMRRILILDLKTGDNHRFLIVRAIWRSFLTAKYINNKELINDWEAFDIALKLIPTRKRSIMFLRIMNGLR